MIDRGVGKRTKVTFMALENKKKRREKKDWFQNEDNTYRRRATGNPTPPL